MHPEGIDLPKADMFTMTRLSLTEILNGDHVAATLLHMVSWIDKALAKSAPLKKGDPRSGPGVWMWLSDADIARRMVQYNNKSLFGLKAIGKAVKRLQELGYIEVRFDPRNPMSRRRQVRLANLEALQREIDDWSARNPRLRHGIDELAVYYAEQIGK